MNRTVRNIIIMALFTTGGGWLGIWLNQVTGNTQPPMQSLGALVWLVSPALSGILLRAFGGDGWKDSGFGLHLHSGGWKWYLVAFLVYPLAALLAFGLALLLKAVSTGGFAVQGMSAYGNAVIFMLGASLMKNLFEEFAWRGYLTPRLEAANIHPVLNHLIVGILWWSWHLPYYHYFLDRTQLSTYLGTSSLAIFLLLALIDMFPTAFLFGEIRLLSKSVWPAFILHQLLNALSMPLLLSGFIALNGTLGLFLSPTMASLRPCCWVWRDFFSTSTA
jgi:membrane protease YdiL (CAAX protease family)